jgi:2-polyprenyl-3-methyl-5-hydroxy-6-metoxy-1,4-benzoquinol methylase
MKLNKLKFFILTFLGISIGFLLSFYSQTHTVPYFLNLTFKSKQKSTCQLFYDIGKGYSERHSVRKNFDGNQTGKLTLDLPAQKIHGLRFDPLECSGSLEIKSILILGKEKVGNQHKVLHKFDLKFLKAVQQVDLVMNNTGNVVATTHNDCNDPIIELSLKEPFDHWQLKDFLGIEWLNKSAFFSFLITPIALAFSFSENKRRDITEKVSLKFNKQNHSLEWGDTFTSEPENCYQDTKEENIRSIIEKINNGTPWKQAVREKFEANNPWLYNIVTSRQRTKFLDEFIMPQNLQVLDIGAGWGQFTLPLAKQNQICSLEPTPERLDFIRTASEQEKVSKNISFIGADYLDINFKNKFDLILSIGVLEWIGKFSNSVKAPLSAQSEFLAKTQRDLTGDGKLVIGIENRLGLKYILGANDDHTGLPHISYLCQELAKTKYEKKTKQELECFTYSLVEYKNLLNRAGFTKIKFFATLPDYKLPEQIFPISDDHKECELNKFIVEGGQITEYDGSNGKKLENQNELSSMYKSLAEMNIAHFFCPSFFITAS